jgi:hypothetical protein
MVGLHKHLADQPARLASLDREMTEAATRWNHGGPLRPALYEIEYLLIVARTRNR